MQQSINQITLLQKQIQQLTDDEINIEVAAVNGIIKKSKPLLMKVVRKMKTIPAKRLMIQYISDLCENLENISQHIIYMYYLGAEWMDRNKDTKHLLLVWKKLKDMKQVISLYEKERWSVYDNEMNELCFLWSWSMIKLWQDTAHLMADHQEIINLTIGKAKKKKNPENHFIFNQLLKDVQELQDTWEWVIQQVQD